MKTNKNGVKLLAAVMVLALAFAGIVVLTNDSDAVVGETSPTTIEIDAATDFTDETITSGTYDGDSKTLTITSDTILELTTDIGSESAPLDIMFKLKANLTITSDKDKTIYIKTTTQNGVVYFDADNKKFTVTGKVTVNLDSNVEDRSVINNQYGRYVSGTDFGYKATVEVIEGATLNITHENGKSTWMGGAQGYDKNLLVINGATVNFNETHSVQAVYTTITNGHLNITNPQKTGAGLYAVLNNSEIKVTGAVQDDGTTSGLFLYVAKLTNNSKITVDADVSVFNGVKAGESFDDGKGTFGVLQTDATSSITAVEIRESAGGSTYAGSNAIGLIGNIDADLNIAKGLGLGTDVILEKGNVVTIVEGMTVSGNVSFSDSDSKISLAGVTAGSEGMTLSHGSVIIGGVVDTSNNGTITVVSGTAKLNANVDTGVTITVNSGATLEIPENTNVSNSGTITVNGTLKVLGTIDNASNSKLNIEEEAEMIISGSITEAENASETIKNNGTISITSSKAVVPSTINGTGTVDASAGSTEGTISGQYSTNSTFTNTQVITVTADTYLVDNAVFTIQGTLIIPEGVTLYIQDNARLVITGQAANLKVDGNIVIESAVDANSGAGVVRAGALLIEENAKAENNGVIELSYSSVDGSVSQHPGMNITSTFVNKGQIIVGTESFLYIWGSNLTNAKDASIIIDGQIKLDEAADVIYNAGEIIIDAIIFDNNLTIELTDANAVVDIVSATVKNNMQNETTVRNIVVNNGFTPSGYTKDEDGLESSISFGLGVGNTISGVKITPTSVLDNTTKKYNEYLVIDGALGYAFSDDATKSITITFQNVKVENELDVEAGLEIISTGTLDVDGTITLEKESSTKKSTLTISGASSLLNVDGAIVAVDGTQIISSSDGKMTVSGSVQAGSDFGDLKDNTNATYYVTKVGTKTTHILTTFENAVAGVKDPSNTNTTKNVTVCGNETVSDDVVVVDSNVKIVFNNTSSELTIGKDSVVTIADGSSITNSTAGAITVNGALIIENKKTGDKASTAIVSDVTTQTTDNNGYRIYSGLAYALENVDDGSVVKLNKGVTIDDSISIPEGITVDATGKTITVEKEKILTIDGTLSINDSTTITCKGTGDSQAKVVLNGTVQSTYNSIYDKYQFAAAYYSVKGVFYAEPVASAISKIGDADDGTVTLKGEVSTGDLTIVGSADKTAILVVTEKLTAGTITLDEAQITINSGASLNGTIADANGSVKLDGTASASTTIASVTIADDKILTISGNITVGEKKTITLSGDVLLNAFTGDDVTVLGDVIVAVNSTATNLTVDGTVAVANSKTLSVKTAKIFGTVSMGSNAILNVISQGYVVVGEAPTSLGSNGTIRGTITLASGTYVKAYAGSEVTETETTTVVTLNGVDYATVYYKGEVSLRTVIGLSELQAIPGYSITKEKYEQMVPTSITDDEYALKIEALPVTIDVSVDVGTKIQLGPYFYNQTTAGIKLAVGEYTVFASALTGYSGTPVAELWIDGKKVQDIDGTITLTPEMTSKKVVIVSTFGTAPVDPETPVDPSEDYIVSTSVVDNNKVIVSVISLDGGYLVAGTEVEVTFTTLVETVAFGQTIYKPTPVTETITIGDDKPTIDNSTYELADILGDKYAVINVISKIGTAGFGNTSLNYKG